LRKRVLIVTNSLHKKSESFIVNHILDVAEFFGIEVLVHQSKIEIPESSGIKAVHVSNINNHFPKRLILAMKLLIKDPKYYSFFLNPFRYGRNAMNLSLVLMAHALRGKEFDCYHSHFGNNGLLIAQLKKAGMIKGKCITTFHGLDFTSPKYHGAYYRDLIKYGDIQITVTEFSKRILEDLCFDPSNLMLVPVGTDTSFFTKSTTKKTSEPFKILFVGRLITLKGVNLLHEIPKKLLDLGVLDFRLKIVGDGPLSQELRNQMKSYSSHVEILGFLGVNEVKELMQDSDVLVYPGIRDEEGRVENQCVTIQEASASGLPVVASSVGGVPETVLDGINGFLVKEGDTSEMVQKLLLIKNDRRLAEKMGNEGRAFIKSKYDSLKINQKIRDIYL